MRVMLVDDEWWSISQLQMECEAIGGIDVVGCFENPLEALEFARATDIDLAFLDIEMPEMNGMELARGLREINPELAIVFVSAYENYTTEIFDIDSAIFVTKPYTTSEISQALSKAL